MATTQLALSAARCTTNPTLSCARTALVHALLPQATSTSIPIRPICEGDVKVAVEHVLQTESVSETEARRIALERYRKIGIIRTYGPQPRALRASWERLIDRFKNDRSMHGKNSIIRHSPHTPQLPSDTPELPPPCTTTHHQPAPYPCAPELPHSHTTATLRYPSRRSSGGTRTAPRTQSTGASPPP